MGCEFSTAALRICARRSGWRPVFELLILLALERRVVVIDSCMSGFLDSSDLPARWRHLLLSPRPLNCLSTHEHSLHRTLEDGQALLNLLRADNERRHKPQRIPAAANNQQPSLPRGGDHGGRIPTQL